MLPVSQAKLANHYFSPPRPPLVPFSDRACSPLNDYVYSLFPTPTTPTQRGRRSPIARSHSAPPSAFNAPPSTSPVAVFVPNPKRPTIAVHSPAPHRTTTFPLPRGPSPSRPTATYNGDTYVDSPTPASPPSSSKPSFPSLHRTPSSAFIAASKNGKVNPLTMQELARRGSELEAIKLHRERERKESSGGSISGSVRESRPGLGRKESWSRAVAIGEGIVRTASPSSSLKREEPLPQTTSSTSSFSAPSHSHGMVPALPSSQGVPGHPTALGNKTQPARKVSVFKKLGRNRVSSSTTIDSVSTSAAPAPSPTTPNARSVPMGLTPPIASASLSPPHTPGLTAEAKGKEKEKVKTFKVKTKNKSQKDFKNLFLAQELHIPRVSELELAVSRDPDDTRSTHSGPTTGENGEQTNAAGGASSAAGGKNRKKNAVWAIKFSPDGKYLAAGGKDGVVRVWETLSNPTARSEAENPAEIPDPAAIELTATASVGQAGSKRKKGNSAQASGTVPVATMPVFATKPVKEYRGHESDVLDLCWSKNNFLLSSSMDKQVRLWHFSRDECLCAFQHLDFVTSIAFHPRDDRFFLSGSLDCKLRLWNIPERRVHCWTELPELITSVAFTSDGKLAIAGGFTGVCMFFEVETFRYHTQFASKSTRGKNSKGKKITSMLSMPVAANGGEKLLVSSNDSRMRLYEVSEKAVLMKYSGHENASSQIRASFSDDAKYIVSGSEDGSVYIWESGMERKPQPGFEDEFFWQKTRETPGCESFSMPGNIITCAVFAPTNTHKLLADSNDPIFSSPEFLSYFPSRGSLTGAPTPVFSPTSKGASSSSAEDAIIVVADDATGVLSVIRNSPLPKGYKRRGSRSSAI